MTDTPHHLNPDPPLDIPTLSAMVEKWRKWVPNKGNYVQRLAYRMARELLDFKMQMEIAEGLAEKKWTGKVKK